MYKRRERGGMVIKPCYKNKVDLEEIKNCHYVYTRDLVRINMSRLWQLVELSNFIRQQILVKYGKLSGLRAKRRKKLDKKRRSAVAEYD